MSKRNGVAHVLKWIFAIVYHPVMIVFCVIALVCPFILYGSIKGILTYEVPNAGMPSVVIALVALWVYLAMKSEFLGRPYRKITILLPLMQFIVYYCVALQTAVIVLNKWADEGAYPKERAIVYALIGVAVVRVFMMLLYWRQPIARESEDGNS